jgi:surface antigen
MVPAARPPAVQPTAAEPAELAEIREAILRATPHALRRGRPVTWKAGEARGYVVPSEAQEGDGRSCRNVYATNIAGDRQDQGGAHRWCREDGSRDWAPE